MTDKLTAIELAFALDSRRESSATHYINQAAAELRRLHAANVDCVAWFEAIKADNERLHALNVDLLRALTRIRALPVHADAIRMAHKYAEDAIANTGGAA